MGAREVFAWRGPLGPLLRRACIFGTRPSFDQWEGAKTPRVITSMTEVAVVWTNDDSTLSKALVLVGMLSQEEPDLGP